MRAFKSLPCIICASLILAGCASTDSQTSEAYSEDITNPDVAMAQDSGPSVSPVLKKIAAEGSVEIYSLDDTDLPADAPSFPDRGPEMLKLSAENYSERPEQVANESSVEIYPLDGGMHLSVQPVAPSQGYYTPEPVQAAPVVPVISGDVDEDNFRQEPEQQAMQDVPVISGEMQEQPQPQPQAEIEAVSSRSPKAVVYFAHDSVMPETGAMNTISELASEYRDFTGMMSVEGHASAQSSVADPVKRKIINLKISMDRALSVARALMQKGVPAENIATKAYGETRPVGTDPAANRRVEVYDSAEQ